jgi:hypothetical protein
MWTWNTSIKRPAALYLFILSFVLLAAGIITAATLSYDKFDTQFGGHHT